MCKLVAAGEHIVAGEDIYGGTSRLLSQVRRAGAVGAGAAPSTDPGCGARWWVMAAGVNTRTRGAQVVPSAGVSVTNVDMTDLEATRRAIIPGKTKLVIIESPTNPRMQVRWRLRVSRMPRQGVGVGGPRGARCRRWPATTGR